MNILTDREHLKNLLASLRLRPKDYMGQNFLVSEEVLDEILAVAEIKKGERVVEVGPGLGALTEKLADAGAIVFAIEKDKSLVEVLSRSVKNKNVEIISQDILKFNFAQIKSPYKIVANIPYYLTSHLLQILLALENKPSHMVLMMQKEVAERLIAEPGELSILGISVQIFADVHIAAGVPKENFWPMPKVDSCVVVLKPKNKYPEITDQKLFFRILKIAFSGKRKQIHNTLSNGLKIDKEKTSNLLKRSGIDPQIRPQDLEIEQWIKLYRTIEKNGE
jgi:16S rRNA (adenine1518-N6/adenine1519-N6)-dimethyltransferase